MAEETQSSDNENEHVSQETPEEQEAVVKPSPEKTTPKEDEEEVGDHKVKESPEHKGLDPESIIDLLPFTDKKFSAFSESYIKSVGEQTFVARAREEGTFENYIAQALQTESGEEDRVLSFIELKKLYEESNFGQRLFTDEGKPRLGPTTIYKPNQVYKAPMRGRQATLAFKARAKGTVRRVPLLNSGINLLLRAPNINEIISLIERTGNEELSYGRETGVQYFSFGDFVLKRQMIDFVVDMVLDSSLKNWDQDDRQTLLTSIRLPDLPMLLMQIASMEYPKGYKNFRLMCFNEDCKQMTEGLTVDLQKFIHNRFAAMDDECIKYLEKTRNSSNEAEFKDLEWYSKKLGLDGQIIEIGEYRYHFKVPTLDDYLKVGAQVVSDIVADTQGSTPDARLISIASRNILTYLPWISKIEVLRFDDEDPTVEPEVQMYFDEPESMFNVLLDIAEEPEAEVRLQQEMFKLMDLAQISIVCYAPEPCPSCGKKPPTESGMVSLDPVSSFFTQAYWLVKRHFQRKMELMNRS